MPFPSARRTRLVDCLASAACFASAVCLAITGLLFGSAAADEPPAAASAAATAPATFKVDDKAREDVKTMPLEMARVIEAKQFKIAVEKFMDPDFYKRQVERAGGMDAFVKQFEEKYAPEMLRSLKATKGLEPTMIGADRAMFDLKGMVENKGDREAAVPLKKVGKYWYIGI
jgi:hypothetical protein